jgi:hypothetical protein
MPMFVGPNASRALLHRRLGRSVPGQNAVTQACQRVIRFSCNLDRASQLSGYGSDRNAIAVVRPALPGVGTVSGGFE